MKQCIKKTVHHNQVDLFCGCEDGSGFTNQSVSYTTSAKWQKSYHQTKWSYFFFKLKSFERKGTVSLKDYYFSNIWYSFVYTNA